MAELVGYTLTGPNGEVQRWGGVWGTCPGKPDVLFLPGDVQVHAAELDTPYLGGDELEYTLSQLMMDPPAPTADDVWAEMHRRWEGGFDYDFGDDRGVQRIGTTEKDMTDWQKVQALATAATNLGQPDTPIYIVTDTGGVTIKASEWWPIVIATGVFQQPIFQGAAALVAMDPIPADYATNDSYWTAAS